jgi:hypothetical protein
VGIGTSLTTIRISLGTNGTRRRKSQFSRVTDLRGRFSPRHSHRPAAECHSPVEAPHLLSANDFLNRMLLEIFLCADGSAK